MQKELKCPTISGQSDTLLIDKMYGMRFSFCLVDISVSLYFQIEKKVGRCTPLWNLYNSIILVSVCQYTVDAFVRSILLHV